VINRAAKELSLEDFHKTQESVARITSKLKEFCRLLPEGRREQVCGAVQEIELATEFPDKLGKIEQALEFASSAVAAASKLEDVHMDIKQVLTELHVVNNKVGEIDNKLDEIGYSIFRQRISFGNAISNLAAMKTELEKLYQIAVRHPNSSLKEIYSCREEQLQDLSRGLEERFAELKDLLKETTLENDVKVILNKLDLLKPVESWNSKAWNLADKRGNFTDLYLFSARGHRYS